MCVAAITWSVTPQRRCQHKQFKQHPPLSSSCCCSPETRCSTGRRSSSSHLRPVAVQPRKQGEGSASSASAAARGGGGTWTTAACCAVQHSEGHSTKQCEVGPCIQCATRTSWKEGKGASMKACEGPGPRGLVPAMNANGPVTRRHTQVGEVLH